MTRPAGSAARRHQPGGIVSDERVTAFLNWLTEDGRVPLGYAPDGAPAGLRLGLMEVRRSDLARVARAWPGCPGLSAEAADALAGQALARVPAAEPA
jgi:hypothetical protein